MSRFKRKPGTDECDVGIFEYVSPAAGGIGGELNVLASDFCVNELDTRGREVRHRPYASERAEATAHDDASSTTATLAMARVALEAAAERDAGWDGASSTPTEVAPDRTANATAAAAAAADWEEEDEGEKGDAALDEWCGGAHDAEWEAAWEEGNDAEAAWEEGSHAEAAWEEEGVVRFVL